MIEYIFSTEEAGEILAIHHGVNGMIDEIVPASELITFEQWRRNRGTYIGGSDAAAILGLSPFRTIGECWIEKVQAQERAELGDETLDPEMTTRFSAWGRRLESVVVDAYAEETGFTIQRPGLTLYRHPDLPFIGGTIDATAITPHGDKRVVEAKTTDGWYQYREQLWGESGSDVAPDWYVVQLMQYLIVRRHEGFTMGDFAVLIGGNDFRILHIEYDDDLAGIIVDTLTKFWRMVTERRAPSFDYAHKNAVALQRRIWNRVEGESIVVPANYRVAPSHPTVIELFIEHADAEMTKKDAEARSDAAKAQLMHITGNNSSVTIEGTPLAIVRSHRKGYHVDAYDVEPSITVGFAPRLTKKREEVLNGFREEIATQRNRDRIGTGRRRDAALPAALGSGEGPAAAERIDSEHEDANRS